jgi:hypothetical protein
MTSHRERWQARQKRAAERKPWIRLDRYYMKPQTGKDTYEVVIEGFHLASAVSPPRITLGGVPVRGLKFKPDGRAVWGILSKEPANDVLVVDYGYARAELEERTEGEPGWRPGY